MVEEFWLAGKAHGIDAAFREGKVDGLGEVERCCAWVPKVCIPNKGRQPPSTVCHESDFS